MYYLLMLYSLQIDHQISWNSQLIWLYIKKKFFFLLYPIFYPWAIETKTITRWKNVGRKKQQQTIPHILLTKHTTLYQLYPSIIWQYSYTMFVKYIYIYIWSNFLSFFLDLLLSIHTYNDEEDQLIIDRNTMCNTLLLLLLLLLSLIKSNVTLTDMLYIYLYYTTPNLPRICIKELEIYINKPMNI